MLYTNLFFSFTSSPTASTSNHTTLHKLILCPLHSPIITPIYTGLYSALSHFQPLHLRNNRTDLHQFIFLQPLPLHLIIWAIFFYFRPKICTPLMTMDWPASLSVYPLRSSSVRWSCRPFDFSRSTSSLLTGLEK